MLELGFKSLSGTAVFTLLHFKLTFTPKSFYQAVPFLWELEVLLNWVCTETTLTLDYWVKYSDIKAYLFKLKCWQVSCYLVSSSLEYWNIATISDSAGLKFVYGVR